MLIGKISFSNLKKYVPLMRELVKRDLKVKYRRSVLGYLWSLLNPLMMMMILSYVFSHAFKTDIEYFPLYVISGNVLFTFFNDSTNYAMHSITGNGELIKKVYIPKYIFPLSNVLSSFVTALFSLMAVLVVMIFLRVPFHWQVLLVPIPIFFEFVFCVGVGLILAALSVYFRDINHLYGVLTLAWMYGTPIFYPIESLPERVAVLIKFNPLYNYIQFFRLLIMKGYIPGINTWIACAVSSLVSLIIGIILFKKMQRNFILYL